MACHGLRSAVTDADHGSREACKACFVPIKTELPGGFPGRWGKRCARLHVSDAAPDCRAEGLTDATVCVSEGPSRAPGEEGHIPAAVGNLSAADALLHARLAPGRRRVFLTVTSCGVFALRPLVAT